MAMLSRRRLVAYETHVRDLILCEFEILNVYGAPLLIGFQDESQCAFLTAKMIIEELKLPLIAEVKSRGFPATAHLWNGCVTGPCRIFGDQRLVVLLATFNAKGDIAHDLAELILRFAGEKRLPHIISVEGLKQALELQPGEHPPRSEPEVAALLRRQMMSSDREGAHPKFYTTNTSVREAFLAAGSEATGQFTINGVTGALANEVLYTVDLEHTVVFPQYSPFYTDAAAPARAIRLLQTAFPALLDVATGSLDDAAGQQQSKLKHVVDDLEGGERPAATSMYS